jgi:hypothetical protein
MRRHACVYAFSAIAFMGLPCPKKIAGIRLEITMTPHYPAAKRSRPGGAHDGTAKQAKRRR